MDKISYPIPPNLTGGTSTITCKVEQRLKASVAIAQEYAWSCPSAISRVWEELSVKLANTLLSLSIDTSPKDPLHNGVFITTDTEIEADDKSDIQTYTMYVTIWKIVRG